MREKTVALVAGQSGSKSTFVGGLIRHIQNIPDLTIYSDVHGSETDYHQYLIEEMFSKGKYPEQTEDGYQVDFKITGDQFARPKTELTFIDIPGEYQREIFQGRGTSRDPLMLRIRDDKVPDQDTVEQVYEDKIESKFVRGNPPSTTKDWETTILYHLFQANDVIFLLSLHKIIEQNIELAYDRDTIEWATNNFRNVAVIPTAVELAGYDPDTYDPGLLERIANILLSPESVDDSLYKTLNTHINDQKAMNVINYANAEAEIAFYSVSVPDQNRDTGNLTDDGEGGFVVKGFDTIIEWLES